MKKKIGKGIAIVVSGIALAFIVMFVVNVVFNAQGFTIDDMVFNKDVDDWFTYRYYCLGYRDSVGIFDGFYNWICMTGYEIQILL